MQKNPINEGDSIQEPMTLQDYEDAVSLPDGIYPITDDAGTVLDASVIAYGGDTVDDALNGLNGVVVSGAVTGTSAKYTIPTEVHFQKNRYITYMGKFVFLNLTISCVTPSSSSEQIASGLPYPTDDLDNTIVIPAISTDAGSQLVCTIQNEKLYAAGGTAGKVYKISAIYPVKS